MSIDPSKQVWLDDLETAVRAVSQALGDIPADVPIWLHRAIHDADLSLSDTYGCLTHESSSSTGDWISQPCDDYLYRFGQRSRELMRDEARARIEEMNEGLDSPTPE